MIKFEQGEVGSSDHLLITLSEDSNIHDAFRAFTSFLRAQTYGDSTIYHGLIEATNEMEEVLECSYKTYKKEVLID